MRLSYLTPIVRSADLLASTYCLEPKEGRQYYPFRPFLFPRWKVLIYRKTFYNYFNVLTAWNIFILELIGMSNNAIFDFLKKSQGRKKAPMPTAIQETLHRVVRAIIYARVSRDEQGRDGKVSLDQQINHCRVYCRHMGMVVVAELREDYTGAKARRPEMDRAMRMFSEGEADALVVMTNDRFHRAVSVFYILYEELKGYGAELHFVDVGKVDDTNLGILIVVGAQNAMSEGERNKVVRRMTDAKHDLVKLKKVPIMSAPAYGLKKIGKNTLALDEARAEVVRQVFQTLAYGSQDNGEPTSARVVCTWLNTRRAPTSDLKNGKPKTGQWSTAMVCEMVKNPIYCGHYYYGKTKMVNGQRVNVPPEEWNEVILPPELCIVDEQTWRLANERVQENTTKSKRPMKVHYLLSGHVYCGTCGHRMKCSVSGKPVRDEGGQIVRYYRRYGCNTSYRIEQDTMKNPCATRSGTVSADIIEAATVEWLHQLVERPQDVRDGLEMMAQNVSDETNPLRSKLEATRAAIAAQEQVISELLENLPNFQNSKRLKAECEQKILMADATREKLEAQAAEMEAELGQANVTVENLGQLYHLAPTLRSKLDSANWSDLRWLVETLNLRVTIYTDPNNTKNRWMEVKCMFSPAVYYRLMYHNKKVEGSYEGPYKMLGIGTNNATIQMGENL